MVYRRHFFFDFVSIFNGLALPSEWWPLLTGVDVDVTDYLLDIVDVSLNVSTCCALQTNSEFWTHLKSKWKIKPSRYQIVMRCRRFPRQRRLITRSVYLMAVIVFSINFNLCVLWFTCDTRMNPNRTKITVGCGATLSQCANVANKIWHVFSHLDLLIRNSLE